MFPAALLKGHNQRRLRNLLALLFLGLAIPTGAVIWQAYDQLKWEAWYQYRNQAEELTDRIDLAIKQQITVAEARNFTDFSFLNATTSSNVLQRSPLATFPVPQDVPGVIGYFQVDPEGAFSTPLIPVTNVAPADVGLAEADLAARQQLANSIRQILADNQLVSARTPAPAAGRVQLSAEIEEIVLTGSRQEAVPDPQGLVTNIEEDRIAASRAQAEEPATEAAAGMIGAFDLSPATPADEAEFSYEQKGFDQLNQPAELADAAIGGKDFDAPAEGSALQSRANAYGKVRDLRLDEELQKKSEDFNRNVDSVDKEAKSVVQLPPMRGRRVEQELLPAPMPAAVDEIGNENVTAAITTFESEIDPFQFSLLDSGHLVLFRNVWRNGSRFIQGLLIEQPAFSQGVIETAFHATTLSEMSNLVIGYQDDIINVIRGGSYDNLVSASELDDQLLYRSRLSAPLDSLELIFSINRMPPGPGAAVLGWTTVVIALVFLAGFFALYRLGLSQIKLARQQQDFVSAVSHELKTPLTSIRMYGEMLKEGWADEKKQKQYYEYIHDESERLTRLISNVLQLARITRNEPQFDMHPVSIGALMDQIQSKISNQVERAGFELVLTSDKDSAGQTINVDDDCFAQIIINLVDNAIKFSKDADEKKVEISSGVTSNQQVAFTIRDYGPGIPKNQLKKIFQLFYRTESELTRETVGTGIGLAIVHQLTNAMDGTVDVVNKDPGVEFRVSFPT